MPVTASALRLVRVPTVTAQPAFDGLLLGWHGQCVASASARRAMTPILHHGDGHLITIAPTGAGKGVGALIPALLSHAGSAVLNLVPLDGADRLRAGSREAASGSMTSVRVPHRGHRFEA